jgi:DNA-directed RNA polymerase subunit K/omega
MSKKLEYEETSDIESDVENMNSDEDEDEPKPPKVLKKLPAEDEGSDDDDDISIEDDIEDIENLENNSDLDEDEHRYDFPSSTASEANIRRKIIGDEDEDEDEDAEEEYDENYLQKFDESLQKNVISEHHPELVSHNYEEIEALCRVVRDERGIIMDPLHKTMPFITKYEKTKILGERAKQINAGAQSTVIVDENIIDGYLIALKEYENKSIPMIIRRPLPNGGCEYWRLDDLEQIV